MHHTPATLEIKNFTENGSFAGYASLFNITDSQNDCIERGAFTGSLSSKTKGDIKLLWQHRMDEPIGHITNLFEDERGLYLEAQLLLSVKRAQEAYDLIKSGVLKGLSIGYRPTDVDYHAKSGVRRIKQLDLYEVSLVTFPANEAANITVVKSLPPSKLISLSDALSRALHTLH